MWIGAIVVQIILDPLLIFGFDLGVSGAAVGTVGGQTVSAVMSWWFFFARRERPYPVRLADRVGEAGHRDSGTPGGQLRGWIPAT